MGLVASLNRPGGNVTGVTILDVELGPKRLELLHQLVPTATVMAALINPNDPNRAKIIARELQSAANTLGLQLHVLNAGNDRDFDSVFADMVQLRVGGLVIGGDPLFNSRSQQLGNLALQHSIPAIYQLRSIRCVRWPDRLRCQACRYLPFGWSLCWPGSQGRETRRPASPTGDRN